MASKDIQTKEFQVEETSLSDKSQYSATYHIVENPQTKESLVKKDNNWIFWTTTTDKLFRDPVISLRASESTESPIVAAARLISGGRKGVEIVLGDPKTASRKQWGEISYGYVNDEKYGASTLKFPFEGEIYAWKKSPDLTRFKDVGNGDLTLHATSDGGKRVGQELGKYLRHRKAVSSNQTGRIDFSVDVGRDFELLCIATIIGMEAAESRVVKKGGNSVTYAGYGAIVLAGAAGGGA